MEENTKLTAGEKPEIDEKVISEPVLSKSGWDYLYSTAKWAGFLAILALISTGFLALLGVLIMILSPIIGEFQDFDSIGLLPDFTLLGVGLFYLLIAVFYSLPAIYLYKFSSKTKKAFRMNNQKELDDALRNLRKTFKFIGILVVVMLAISLLIIPVFAIVFGFFQAMI